MLEFREPIIIWRPGCETSRLGYDPDDVDDLVDDLVESLGLTVPDDGEMALLEVLEELQQHRARGCHLEHGKPGGRATAK